MRVSVHALMGLLIYFADCALMRPAGGATVGKLISALNTWTKARSVSAFTARKGVQLGELSPGHPLSLPSVAGVAMVTGKLAHNFKRACLEVTRPFHSGIV